MYEQREKIRGLLAKYCLSYVWLVSQLNKRGVDITPNELCQYITGRRRGSKAQHILGLCIEILDTYVELYELKLVDIPAERSD